MCVCVCVADMRGVYARDTCTYVTPLNIIAAYAIGAM